MNTRGFKQIFGRRALRNVGFCVGIALFGLSCSNIVEEPPIECDKFTTIPEKYIEQCKDVQRARKQSEIREAIEAFNPDGVHSSIASYEEDGARWEGGLNQSDQCFIAITGAIGSLQQTIYEFNQLVSGTINTITTVQDGIFAPGYKPLASEISGNLGKAFDFGQLVESAWVGSQGQTGIEKAMRGTWEYAERARGIPDCEVQFTPAIAGYTPKGDNDLKYDGVPLRFLSNDTIEDVRRRDGLSGIAAEIRLGNRWDAVEVALFGGFFELLTSAVRLMMSHSYEMKLDIDKLANAVGIDLEGVLECFTDPGSWRNTAISREHDTDGDGRMSTTDECIAVRGQLKLYGPNFLRRIGGLTFGDNPGFTDDNGFVWDGFGGADRKRWPLYAHTVDNLWANSYSLLDSIFDALVARLARTEGPQQLTTLEAFAFVFKDNGNGEVGGGDTLGFNIPGVRLALSTDIEAALPDTISLEQIEELIPLFVDFLIIRFGDDAVVDSIRTLLANTEAALRAVDDPSINATYIKISDFSKPLGASPFFEDDVNIPDIAAFDLTQAFTNLVPMAMVMPYSEAVLDPPVGDNVRNEWIIETEAVANAYRDYFAYDYLDPVTYDLYIEEGYPIVRHYEKTGDTAHFDASYLDENAMYYALDVSNNVLVESAPYLYMQPDCFAPASYLRTSEWHRHLIYYYYFRDPSFNGLFLTNQSEIARAKEQFGATSGCPSGISADFLPADHKSVHEAMSILIDWMVTQNVLSDVLNDAIISLRDSLRGD